VDWAEQKSTIARKLNPDRVMEFQKSHEHSNDEGKRQQGNRRHVTGALIPEPHKYYFIQIFQIKGKKPR